MSEWINNQTHRKESIKNIIRQLHDGKTVDEVKAQFAALLDQTDGEEISRVEQLLINEGLPVSEVQRLCDVHTSVFREALDKQARPETTPGHPIHSFVSENRAAAIVINATREAINAFVHNPSEGTAHKALFALQKLASFDRHYRRKEYLLFPYLEKHQFTGPSQVMWGIHDQIRASWKTLAGLLTPGTGGVLKFDAGKILDTYKPMETAMQEMFYKEENILFPTALEYLNEDNWLEIRSQEADTGYAFIEPGDQWRPEKIAPKDSSLVTHENLQLATPVEGISLETGVLSPLQINLLLKNLPIDVTYVDENDTVLFYSATGSRVFQRDPSIIGRKVQNCHPPHSVSKVQKILDDFRAGKRDSAEFWIQMGGKFIHIEYLALRDGAGAYRGTLEVTQDGTHLRSLEGERRLLDEA
jgi:uncharacterized protein